MFSYTAPALTQGRAAKDSSQKERVIKHNSQKERVVLAYSGGLDTTAIIPCIFQVSLHLQGAIIFNSGASALIPSSKRHLLVLGVSPERAPEEGETITLTFEEGAPTALNGKKMKASDILKELNELGGRHGIGSEPFAFIYDVCKFVANAFFIGKGVTVQNQFCTRLTAQFSGKILFVMNQNGRK